MSLESVGSVRGSVTGRSVVVRFPVAEILQRRHKHLALMMMPPARNVTADPVATRGDVIQRRGVAVRVGTVATSTGTAVRHGYSRSVSGQSIDGRDNR